MLTSDLMESSPAELSSLDKSLSVIVDSLTQKNPIMVKAVRDLVAELCRITLLWDEMWLAALMQRQGEVHRRLMQIDAETKRTMGIPNHILNHEAKDAIMRQKYVATMKPVRDRGALFLKNSSRSCIFSFCGFWNISRPSPLSNLRL